ncbi:hypothetical protein TNCV_2166671 [Trichonephila clavipes]|nr:hypothetical protein TNCV_2166671 [Trichonephila clavipes]
MHAPKEKMELNKTTKKKWKENTFQLFTLFAVLKMSQLESLPKPDEIGKLVDKAVDLARQINSEEKGDGVLELLDFHNQELTMDELIEMHK